MTVLLGGAVAFVWVSALANATLLVLVRHWFRTGERRTPC